MQRWDPKQTQRLCWWVQNGDANFYVHAVRELHAGYQQITGQLGGVIVGMNDVIEQLLTAMLCRAHCILEGVPGLTRWNLAPGETLTVRLDAETSHAEAYVSPPTANQEEAREFGRSLP